MKKILSLVVVLIAIGQVYATGPKPHSPLGMSVIKQGQVVKLFYRGEERGKVKVTIYNEKGGIVFTETMDKTEQFMRPYNFTSLPAGEYTIELTDGQGKRFQTVKHEGVNRKRPAHLSRLGKGTNKFMLAVPNKGPEKITVRIFDQENRLLYQEIEVVEGDFAKVYNLGKFDGQAVFEVVDGRGRASRLTKSNR